MEPSKDKSIMVKCDCGAEVVEVYYYDDKEHPEFDMSFWQQGFHRPMGWRERLRWIWRVLRTGNPWSDYVVLSPKKAKEIADFINQNINEQKTEK